jgi:hypothetical protein
MVPEVNKGSRWIEKQINNSATQKVEGHFW